MILSTQEQGYLKYYGTTNPCCGNCQHVRSFGSILKCPIGIWETKDIDSVKCVYYKFNSGEIQPIKESEIQAVFEIRESILNEFRNRSES